MPERAQASRESAKGFINQDVTPVEVWKQASTGPNGALIVDYARGASMVKATRTAKNIWGPIRSLNKGGGLGILWILFIDLMAGAPIMMTLTLALLWSCQHGPRFAAIESVLTGFCLGLFAARHVII